jgi:TolB-like protein
MGLLNETSVRDHLERVCNTATFLASPTLCRVLRSLVDQAFAAHDAPVGQRFVSQLGLGPEGESRPATSVAARMQIRRLRQLLSDYYAGLGQHEPIRIEIPKRNYRLRFVVPEALGSELRSRSSEQAPLSIVELENIGLAPAFSWIPSAITRDLIVAFDSFHGVEVTGPLPNVPPAAIHANANEFILLGSVRSDADVMHVTLRLLEACGGVQVWTTRFSFRAEPESGLPFDSHQAISRVADGVADETGAIACRRMQAMSRRQTESLSVHDAVVACWRFLLTGSAEDLDSGLKAAAAAAAAAPQSPVAIAYEAWMQIVSYLVSPDPRHRFPRSALASLGRARSLAPRDPWVLLFLAYALWIEREPPGPGPIRLQLEGRPASGSFQGLLGSLLIVSGLDLARGETLIAEACRRAPETVPMFIHSLSLSRFLQGDMSGTAAALTRSMAWSDPLQVVLRMALACKRGDIGTAERMAAEASDLVLDYSSCLEVMLRRLLHDDHVDAIAAALSPLRLGWFN